MRLNTKLTLGYFDARSEVPYELNSTNKCLFIFVIQGAIAINDALLQKRDAIGIWDTDHISITCMKEAGFLIIETPINQK